MSTALDRDSLDNKPDGEEQHRISPVNMDISEADDKMKRFYGILPKEKFLEPKTVRIVKRESTERRKIDRYPPGQKSKNGSDLSYVAEDEFESDDRSDIENDPPPPTTLPSYSSRTASLPRNYGVRNGQRRTSEPLSATAMLSRPSNLPLRKGQNFKSKVNYLCY